jgi:hypothetical protein
MKCTCGTFFTKINDESQKILWCKNCGSIQIRHFAEDKFMPIVYPQNFLNAQSKDTKTIWHTLEDYPEIHKHVLLQIQLNCKINNNANYFQYYMIEGYCSPDYDSGKPEYYDWSGDRIFGDEKVIKWCELPK